MTTLVIGATGATGRLLVNQLLAQGEEIRIVVRSMDSLPARVMGHDRVTVTKASILALSDGELADLVRGCDAVAFCLGHNMTFKGLFGHPRMLVSEATRRICEAIRATAPDQKVKVVLMNTTGNQNRDLKEKISIPDAIVIGLLRMFLPPHVDNERAADYLRTQVGQDDAMIEWTAVRPDNLIDQAEVTGYALHPSPTASAIFAGGQTSRINVAAFMSKLIRDQAIWQIWKGQMPVIYNTTQG